MWWALMRRRVALSYGRPGQSSLAKQMAEMAHLEILSQLAAWCGLTVVMKSWETEPQSDFVH